MIPLVHHRQSWPGVISIPIATAGGVSKECANAELCFHSKRIEKLVIVIALVNGNSRAARSA